MDDRSRELLVKSIENELENLASIEDEESKHGAINNVVALYKLKIEEEKIDAEYSEHCDKCELEKAQQERETELKNKDIELKSKDIEIKERQIEIENLNNEHESEYKINQLNEQKIDRLVNLGTQVGLSILSIIAYDIWYRRGLRFEEKGTITSPMTRNLLSKILPKR